MAVVGGGVGAGLPGEKGQKGTEWGKETQPPKYWFVESEVMSNRAGQLRAPDCLLTRLFQFSFSLELFH